MAAIQHDKHNNAVKANQVLVPGCLLLSSQSYTLIEQACRDAADLETGGLLVGRRLTVADRLVVVVVYVSGPGAQAIHQAFSFAPDTAFMQSELDRVCPLYAEQGLSVHYVGEWHKHPAEYPGLSEADRQQAQTILQDPAYGLEWGELILPIAIIQKDEFRFNPYYLAILHPQPITMELLVCEQEDLEELLRQEA